MTYVHEPEDLCFEEICDIVSDIASRYGMIRVYLFGSRARGDSSPDSDYDFIVLAPDELDLFDLGGFYGDMEDAFGKVDVICEESMSSSFKDAASSYWKLVYESRD